MPTFTDRLQHAWNAFMNKDPTKQYIPGPTTYYRYDRAHFSRGNERSIVTAVYNRIALDVVSNKIQHVRLDDNERYLYTMNSGLNNCLTLEANIDQTARSFMMDVVISLLDEGCVALVPVDTNSDIMQESFDIETIRVGHITQWYTDSVRIRLYNEKTGNKEEIVLPKKSVAIVENPFYTIMNEPNSTLQRLIRKLSILDAVDEQQGAGKLDLIIQLPYVIKTDSKRDQAERRRKDIEDQLSGSKYGIAYTDGTEHITQLNRPVDNQLLSQIEYLTNLLYSQLGITVEILNGTASEEVMMNYTSRTIEPILSAIIDEMKRKFLTKTARTQKQSIMFFKDPFKLVPVSQIAELADKLTRNEIMTSNEIRQIVGIKPSDDPKADELRNKNLNQSNEEIAGNEAMGLMAEEDMEFQNGSEPMTQEEYESQMARLNQVDSDLDKLESQFK